MLLLQFDVASWLNYRRPKLSERSTFIDLISRALSNIGLNPEEEKLILHEVIILSRYNKKKKRKNIKKLHRIYFMLQHKYIYFLR